MYCPRKLTMIPVTATLAIDERAIEFKFVLASGPGGQHVNKTASAVQLRFDLRAAGLPQPVRVRLRRLAGKRLSSDDILIIDARRFRHQIRNRQDAMDRLMLLLQGAAVSPKPRTKTTPTRGSKRRRLETKRRHGQTKRLRQHRDFSQE